MGLSTSTHMDSGPNTLLWQLMSTASAHSSTTNNDHQDSNTVTTNFNGGTYQVRRVNQSSYHLIQYVFQSDYPGTLIDSGANGGLAGADTCLLSTVPHAHVDISGVGSTVMECLPLIQCASVVDTLDEGKIILIMSQYAHKPDGKTIHSKSQIEHFGGIVYDSAKAAGGSQMFVTHEGYAIPLHVRNGLYYMDMQPASDSDLTTYPQVFITAHSPWNSDIMDEEFFLNSLDSLVDLPIIQQCCDGCDPCIDMYGELSSLSITPSESPFTQDHLDAAVDALVISSQLMPYFGWVRKSASVILWKKPPNITRLINMSPCENISAPVSLLQMSVNFPNGMLLIHLYLTFLPLMMASLDMAGVNCYSSMGNWIQNYCLDTLCLLNLNFLTPFLISSVSMAL